jgi:hypothetical protein
VNHKIYLKNLEQGKASFFQFKEEKHKSVRELIRVKKENKINLSTGFVLRSFCLLSADS